MLAALRDRRGVAGPVALVVAHPDDETVGAGASLGLLGGLLLVHVTDGAPRRLGDAARAGFGSAAAYAAAREAEVRAALAVAGVSPARARLDVPDQDAALHMGEIAAALERLFRARGVAAVLTHAYEGGHPDHDATAFAVQRAAGRLGVPVAEFPSYRAGDGGVGGMAVQRFLPGPAEVVVRLDAAEAARKRAMLGCFASQAAVMAWFDAGVERFRAAAARDFTQAPHAGALNYEGWGWEMTGARFRALVREQVACAG